VVLLLTAKLSVDTLLTLHLYILIPQSCKALDYVRVLDVVSMSICVAGKCRLERLGRRYVVAATMTLPLLLFFYFANPTTSRIDLFEETATQQPYKDVPPFEYGEPTGSSHSAIQSPDEILGHGEAIESSNSNTATHTSQLLNPPPSTSTPGGGQSSSCSLIKVSMLYGKIPCDTTLMNLADYSPVSSSFARTHRGDNSCFYVEVEV
jgi:hypothetical protein